MKPIHLAAVGALLAAVAIGVDVAEHWGPEPQPPTGVTYYVADEPSPTAIKKMVNKANRETVYWVGAMQPSVNGSLPEKGFRTEVVPKDTWNGAHDRNGMPLASEAAKKMTAKHCPNANPLYVEQHGCPK